MRTKILILIFFWTSYNAKCQSDTTCNNSWQEYFVGCTPGIYFRSEPTQNSESLAFLTFGTKVLVCDDCIKFDNKVDNKDWTLREGNVCWKKARMNNTIGYLFSGYLIQAQIHTDKDLCFLIEDAICPTEINYNPKLYWYGIYPSNQTKTNQQEDPHNNKLKLVQVNFTTIGEKCNGAGVPTICISTNNEEKSIFLIGIDQKLNDSIIRQNNIYDQKYGSFIFPGQRVYTTGGYYIQGRGVVTGNNDKDNSPFNFYELALINENNPSISQIFSTDFFQKYKPSLVWDGDLNGDKLPDFLFNDYGHYFFLLSNKPERGELIHKYATLHLWNCN